MIVTIIVCHFDNGHGQKTRIMIEVDRKTYEEAFKKQQLEVVSSFTDSDGTHFYGRGFPTMCTDYAVKGTTDPVARVESLKSNIERSDWVHSYYLIDKPKNK